MNNCGDRILKYYPVIVTVGCRFVFFRPRLEEPRGKMTTHTNGILLKKKKKTIEILFQIGNRFYFLSLQYQATRTNSFITILSVVCYSLVFISSQKLIFT